MKKFPHSLLTLEEIEQLTENCRDRFKDYKPVCHLHTTTGNGHWLLTEIGPNKPNMAYGLHGNVRGKVWIDEINLDELVLMACLNGRAPYVQRDPDFIRQYLISTYEESS